MRRYLIVALTSALTIAPCSMSNASDLAPEMRTKIEKLLELTGARQMGKQMGMGFVQQMGMSMQEANPDFPPRGFEIISEVMAEFFEAESESLYEQLIPLYAKYYTEEDLDAMIEFYASPTGRKVIASMPSLMQESMEIGGRWGRDLMPRVQAVLRDRLAKEGLIEADDEAESP